MLCIITIPSDFHALAIASEYEKRVGRRCVYFDVCRAGLGGDVSIAISTADDGVRLTDAFGEKFSPQDLSAVWLRRTKIPGELDFQNLGQEQSFVLGHEFFLYMGGRFL